MGSVGRWGGTAVLVGIRTWNSEDAGNRYAYFVGVWWSVYMIWCARVVVWCDVRRFEVVVVRVYKFVEFAGVVVYVIDCVDGIPRRFDSSVGRASD